MEHQFAIIWATVVQPLDAGTAQVVQSLAGWVDGRFQLCVVAYFLAILLIAAWSADEDAFLRFFRQIFLASVVFTLASNAGTYNYYVTGLAHGTVASISQAVSNLAHNNLPVDANSFDIMASRAQAVGVAAYNQMPSMSLKSVAICIMIGLYWLFADISILLTFGIYMAAYVVTDILLAVGPIFVALYFFEFTRHLFHGWLRNLFTGMLAQILIVTVVAFFFATMEAILIPAGRAVAAAGSASNSVSADLILMLCLVAGICFLFNFVVLYTLYMAASIAGGLAPPRPWLTRFGGSGAGSNNGGAGSIETGRNTGSGPAAAASAAEPERQYAFTRTVGSAP